MKGLRPLVLIAFIVIINSGCNTQYSDFETISKYALKDKIAGGWAGKIIGVTYGAPTEFRAQGRIFDDSIQWTPGDLIGSIWQDDIYVQLTFMMTMDEYGIDAPAKKYHEMFAKAGYMVWHANMQARKNYFDSIFPPSSGMPVFNPHADDIDFQIEADYLGFMCPGMPVTASEMADKTGHIMNYGDGVYGGIFLSALYTQAFFENDISVIIDKALKSIPVESEYARIVAEVIALHRKYPDDWKVTWNEIQAKWGNDHFCEAGSNFNIDAKLNGAYIVLGLLYGDGDPAKTLEITTRCGQDSDCNPSSAMAVLGVISGFDRLPQDMKDGVRDIGDSLFIHTDYSFNRAVESTFRYAIKLILDNGGKEGKNKMRIKIQSPEPQQLEVSFPGVVYDRTVSVFDEEGWSFKGDWRILKSDVGTGGEPDEQSKYSGFPGDAVEFVFTGSGISIYGNWLRDGGKADVFLDDILIRTIDTYFFYSNQEHSNVPLWHITGLPNGRHVMRLVVEGEKKPESLGTNIYISKAVIYKTAPDELLWKTEQ